jgi:phosphoribosylglycinamide formyltransferase-1
MERVLNLAVLVSGSGRTLQNFVEEIAAGRLKARIPLVVGSKPGLLGLRRAAEAGLPNIVVERKAFANAEAFSERVFTLCDEAGVDLVCFAGWLCLLPIPGRYRHRVMNIHPALLPSFGGHGMFGHHVHEAVINHGCKVSGCTVHFVDNTYDTGPIVMQRVCPVMDGDTADALAARVFAEEKVAYPEAIRLFGEGRLRVEGRRVRVGEG